MGEAGVRLEASPPPSLRPHSFLAACSGGGEAGGQCWRGLCGGAAAVRPSRPSGDDASGRSGKVGSISLQQHCGAVGQDSARAAGYGSICC
jgi:hypothetical protein